MSTPLCVPYKALMLCVEIHPGGKVVSALVTFVFFVLDAISHIGSLYMGSQGTKLPGGCNKNLLKEPQGESYWKHDSERRICQLASCTRY